MKICIFVLFLLASGSAVASQINECYNEAEFYYSVGKARDSNIAKTDIEQVVKNFVIEHNLPIEYLDDYLEAIKYVYTTNLAPAEIASSVFKECMSPSIKM